MTFLSPMCCAPPMYLIVVPRFPIGKGIAGHVAQTRETLNVADAYKDDRFNPAIDEEVDLTALFKQPGQTMDTQFGQSIEDHRLLLSTYWWH